MKPSMKKIIRNLSIGFFAFASICAFGFSAFNNKISAAKAADYNYQVGRDGYHLSANYDLDITFTITSFDQAADYTEYWTVYLVRDEYIVEYNETSHKFVRDRNRSLADYYFPVPRNGIDHAGTYTITIKADDKAYKAYHDDAYDINDLLVEDTGKTFKDVYNLENWNVCFGPMYLIWWEFGSDDYAAKIDCFVEKMQKIVEDSDLADCTISFESNDGGSGTMNNVSVRPWRYTLPENGYEANENKGFLGWKVNGEGKTLAPGTEIKVTSNTKIVAQWKDIVIDTPAPVVKKNTITGLTEWGISGIIFGGALLIIGGVSLLILLRAKSKKE